MNKLLFLATILSLSFLPTVFADAYVSVKGYYKSNGTYVAPHVRSNPNGLKYDNYSYKPSQGLYNSTYGTRGIEWDTPTYITDPDYYLGKSLYESKYTYPTTPTCPVNSYYDGISSCKCNYGYVVSGTSCVYGNSLCYSEMGIMSSYDSLSKSCKCDYGYVIGPSGTCVNKNTYSSYKTPSLTSFACPVNSSKSVTDSTKCTCNSGYKTNPTLNGCVLDLDRGCISGAVFNIYTGKKCAVN
jgi:hypothetical protein